MCPLWFYMNTGMIIYRSWDFMADPQRWVVFMWVESNEKEDSANWGWSFSFNSTKGTYWHLAEYLI